MIKTNSSETTDNESASLTFVRDLRDRESLGRRGCGPHKDFIQDCYWCNHKTGKKDTPTLDAYLS